MGKNSRRRHVDKRRRAAERRRHRAALRARADSDGVCEPIARSEPSGPDDDVARTCRQLEQVLRLVLRERVWVNGWQPEELVRHVRRASGTGAASVLAMAVAADAAHHDRVGNVVHDAWRRQTGRVLTQCGHEPDRDGWLARWLEAGGDGVGLSAARVVLDELLRLPRLPTLMSPPGSTGSVDLDLVDVDAAPSARLVTIRSLLAKAESTEFPAEAEAFTAKAQAMMTEARIDEATVRASSGRPSTSRVSAIRIGIDEPYIASKQTLLHVVARSERRPLRLPPACRSRHPGRTGGTAHPRRAAVHVVADPDPVVPCGGRCGRSRGQPRAEPGVSLGVHRRLRTAHR